MNERTSNQEHRTFLAPNISIAGNGRVFWKDIPIEHFSSPHEQYPHMLMAASELSVRCQHLEDIGMEINGRSAISRDCYSAPADSPWKKLLPRYYTFLRRGTHTVVVLFKTPSTAQAQRITAFSSVAGVMALPSTYGPYEAFHKFQSEGFHAIETSGISYDVVRSLFESLSTEPATLERLLDM